MNQTSSRRYLIRILMLISMASVSVSVSSCHILKHDKAAIAEKKKQEADKKAMAEYDKARKQHYDMQNKETKKMMKQTRKKSSKINKPRKRIYFLGIRLR